MDYESVHRGSFLLAAAPAYCLFLPGPINKPIDKSVKEGTDTLTYFSQRCKI